MTFWSHSEGLGTEPELFSPAGESEYVWKQGEADELVELTCSLSLSCTYFSPFWYLVFTCPSSPLWHLTLAYPVPLPFPMTLPNFCPTKFYFP